MSKCKKYSNILQSNKKNLATNNLYNENLRNLQVNSIQSQILYCVHKVKALTEKSRFFENFRI